MNTDSVGIEILSDLFAYNSNTTGDFPIRVKDSSHVWEENIATNYHWHPDLQFVLMKSGSIEYFINGQSLILKAGQLLFINSRRLHYITSNKTENTVFVALRIHPSSFIVESYPGVLYYERKFGLNNLDYLILNPETDWCAEAVEIVKKLTSTADGMDNDPIPAICDALRLVELVSRHIDDLPIEPNNNQDQLIFLNMAQFIRESYKSKIRIEDISNAGHVSRAKTYNLFDRYAHMSPNTYITNFRLSRSTLLLRDTNLSIAEISALCGFQSSSYFTSVFSKERGMTPREYRSFIKNIASGSE